MPSFRIASNFIPVKNAPATCMLCVQFCSHLICRTWQRQRSEARCNIAMPNFEEHIWHLAWMSFVSISSVDVCNS
eukprot:1370998-Pleurochrysis_carterae.AAC.2